MVNKKIKIIFAFIACFSLFSFHFAFSYTFLQPLPGINECGDQNFTGPCQDVSLSSYLGWLYKFALAAAAFLAVLMIVIGGIQMIVGGASETARSDGKKRIEQAIWGLLLAISAWLVLYSINPDLVKTGLSIPDITVTTVATTDYGVWDFDSGIDEQTGDMSSSLQSLLSCMRGEITDSSIGRISSISDSNYIGNLSACNNSQSCPANCAHTCASCHYGGGTDSGKSYAVDFGDEENKSSLIDAATNCGISSSHILDEGNLVHISTSDCSGI